MLNIVMELATGHDLEKEINKNRFRGMTMNEEQAIDLIY